MKNSVYLLRPEDAERIIEEYEYLGYTVTQQGRQLLLTKKSKKKEKKEKKKSERRPKDEQRLRGQQQ